MEKIIIGVDTGNRCIKTAHFSFISGIKKSDENMPFTQDMLKYNDTCYLLTQNRITYMQDKSTSDEYLVLTLYALVRELEYRGIDMSGTIPISLGVGLPPSHIPLYKKSFRNYFKRGLVTFELNKKVYYIDIQNVTVFAQGYAGIYLDYETISKFGRAYIIDIGGYTTDVISINHGRIDPEFCESFDMGLIHTFNKISREVHKHYGRTPTEAQIDEMISTGIEISPDMPCLKIADAILAEYVEDLTRKLLEFGIDLKFSRGIFMGGGSERLKHWIESSNMVTNPYFILNVHANAQGYEAILNSLN